MKPAQQALLVITLGGGIAMAWIFLNRPEAPSNSSSLTSNQSGSGKGPSIGLTDANGNPRPDLSQPPIPGMEGPIPDGPPKPPVLSGPAKERFDALMAKFDGPDGFKDHEFEGEFAQQLFFRASDTDVGVDLFMDQKDFKKAHAIARGLAGTITAQDRARQRMIDAVRNPSSPELEDAALYAFLAGQGHKDISSLLVEVIVDPKRREAVRTTAAFVIREGLSSMPPDLRHQAREMARSVIGGSFPEDPSKKQASTSGLNVECLAILGGHLDLDDSDRALVNRAISQAQSDEELDVALAALLRHKTPANEILSLLETRAANSKSDTERAMLDQAIRRVTVATTGARELPTSEPPEDLESLGPRRD